MNLHVSTLKTLLSTDDGGYGTCKFLLRKNCMDTDTNIRDCFGQCHCAIVALKTEMAQKVNLRPMEFAYRAPMV